MQQFFGYMGTALSQVMILAILVCVGYFCDKAKLFPEKTARACNDLLFYIITPGVIINSFLNVEFTPKNGLGFLAAVAIAIGFHGAIALLLPLFFRKGGEDRAIFRFAMMYGNVGYMGLPLAQAIAGDLGVFYCSAVVAIFNFFAFTHGVQVMKKTQEPFNIKKLLINPGTIGIGIGLPLFLLNVNLPEVIAAPVAYIGSLNTPMAMLMFGTYLANTDLPEMFRRKENYVVALFKLLVFPLATIGLLRLLGVQGPLLLASAVFAAAPTANNTVMFSAKYGRNTGVASKICGFTSVLSILTMPLCIALANYIG